MPAEIEDDDVSRAFIDRGWSDGLPIVPPTQERVDAMLAAALGAEDHLGFVGPRRGRATAQTVAANAVMAGCAPEHFPIVAAAVSAVADPRLPTRPYRAVDGPRRADDRGARPHRE